MDRVREFSMFGTGYIKNTKIRTLICGLKEKKQIKALISARAGEKYSLPHPLIWKESPSRQGLKP